LDILDLGHPQLSLNQGNGQALTFHPSSMSFVLNSTINIIRGKANGSKI